MTVHLSNQEPQWHRPKLGSGSIRGKVNGHVADDCIISAKKGEYILPLEIVRALGGAEHLDKWLLHLKKQLGLPATVGIKLPDDPDSLGRVNLPGLPNLPGLADGGAVLGEGKEYNLDGTPVESIEPKPSAQAGEAPPKQYDLAGNEMTDEPNKPVDNTLTNQVMSNMGLAPIPDQKPSLPVLGSLNKPATTPAVVAPANPRPAQPVPPPVVKLGSGTLSYTNDNGKQIKRDASTPAGLGFARNEASRQRDLAETNDREAYGAQVEQQRAKATADKDRQSRIDLLNQTIRLGMTNQYDGPQQIAAARQELATITGQQQLGQMADKIANERYQIDQGLAGQKIAAGAHIATAQINHENDLAKAQAAGQISMMKEQQKNIHDILTNGFGVAPTSAAISRYQRYDAANSKWHNQAAKDVAVIKGTQPELAKVYLPLVKQYHETSDPKAKAEIKKKIDKVLGKQRSAMPVFTNVLDRPVFDKTGMTPWKQPQPILGG